MNQRSIWAASQNPRLTTVQQRLTEVKSAQAVFLYTTNYYETSKKKCMKHKNNMLLLCGQWCFSYLSHYTRKCHFITVGTSPTFTQISHSNWIRETCILACNECAVRNGKTRDLCVFELSMLALNVSVQAAPKCQQGLFLDDDEKQFVDQRTQYRMTRTKKKDQSRQMRKSYDLNMPFHWHFGDRCSKEKMATLIIHFQFNKPHITH